jgi:outer membrane protein assembly factor BamB
MIRMLSSRARRWAGLSVGIGALASWMVLTSTALAGIHSGVIDQVSDDGQQIVVKIGSKGTIRTFRVETNTPATLDGKKTSLTALEAGQTITITTDRDDKEVLKVTARMAKAKPDKADADQPAAKKSGSRSARSEKAVAEDSPKSSDAEAADVAPGDWNQYRGPLRDGISRETGLLRSWPEAGPKLVWSINGLGEGYSSVAVVGDLVLTQGTSGRDEMLFALDRDSGERRWQLKTGSVRDDGQGGGPRGTPTVDGDRVYALGANGDLVCAELKTGKVLWQGNILQEFGGNNIVWGISESVLIDGDRLICSPGGKRATIVALNKNTGKTEWTSLVPGAPSASYASPVVVTVDGVRQYVNFVHTGVVGVRADDGTPLWGQEASANGTANCSSPVVFDDAVFTASGYGTGGALIRLASRNNQTQSQVAYATKEMQNHHGGMIGLDGFLYGFDEQVLTCLDVASGKPRWKNRSVGKGSVVCADGMLFLRSENGPVALAEATPEGYRESGRFTPPRSDRPAWSHPVVAGGKLFLRDWDQLMVYNVSAVDASP